jgi:hypothetical protein
MGAARLLLMNMYSEEGFLLSASRKELIKAFVLRRKGDETIQVAPTKSLFWNLAIIHLCSREKCETISAKFGVRQQQHPLRA